MDHPRDPPADDGPRVLAGPWRPRRFKLGAQLGALRLNRIEFGGDCVQMSPPKPLADSTATPGLWPGPRKAAFKLPVPARATEKRSFGAQAARVLVLRLTRPPGGPGPGCSRRASKKQVAAPDTAASAARFHLAALADAGHLPAKAEPEKV